MGPETVQGRIVEIESLSMSEELRNRMRYLGHVPLSKHFQIVELSFDNSVVPAIILEKFQGRLLIICYVLFFKRTCFPQIKLMKEKKGANAVTVKSSAEILRFSALKKQNGDAVKVSL